MFESDEDENQTGPSFSHRGTDFRKEQLTKGLGKPVYISATEAVEKGRHKFVAKRDENSYRGMVKPLTILKRGTVDKMTEARIIAGNAPVRTHTIEPKKQTFLSSFDPTGETQFHKIEMPNLKPLKDQPETGIQYKQNGNVAADSKVFFGENLKNLHLPSIPKIFKGAEDESLSTGDVYLPKPASQQPFHVKEKIPEIHCEPDFDQIVFGAEDNRPSRPGAKKPVYHVSGTDQNISLYQKPSRYAMPWNPQPPAKMPNEMWANVGDNQVYVSDQNQHKMKKEEFETTLFAPDELSTDQEFHHGDLPAMQHHARENDATEFLVQDILDDTFVPSSATFQNRFHRLPSKSVDQPASLDRVAFVPKHERMNRILKSNDDIDFQSGFDVGADPLVSSDYAAPKKIFDKNQTSQRVPISIEETKTFIPWKQKRQEHKTANPIHIPSADTKQTISEPNLKGILKKNSPKIVHFDEKETEISCIVPKSLQEPKQKPLETATHFPINDQDIPNNVSTAPVYSKHRNNDVVYTGFTEDEQTETLVHIPNSNGHRDESTIETTNYGTGYNDSLKPIIPEIAAPRFNATRDKHTPSLVIPRDQSEQVLKPEERFQRQFRKKTNYIVDRTDRFKDTPERPLSMPKSTYKFPVSKPK